MTRTPITRADRLLEAEDRWWLECLADADGFLPIGLVQAMYRHLRSRKPLCLMSSEYRAIYEESMRIGIENVDIEESLRNGQVVQCKIRR